MDSVRNFTSQNRGGIINVVYIIAVLVVVYYLYKFLIEGSDLEVNLLDVETDANVVAAYNIPTKPNPDVRVKTGGEYTISWWMYITSWDYRNGLPKSVLQIVDANEPDYALLTTILYPNENRMMVRVHTDSGGSTGMGGGTVTDDYTKLTTFDSLMGGKQGPSGSINDAPVCDMQEIDLQRWINITITVNGRIVDVFYDGKLTRSCILPDIPVAPISGQQSILVGQKGGFGGKISGIQFMAYPLTPDRIYAIYQAGPRGAAGFLGYIAEKMGIKLTYSGKGGASKSVSA